jgi:hypothetical protein
MEALLLQFTEVTWSTESSSNAGRNTSKEVSAKADLHQQKKNQKKKKIA